MPVTPFHIIVGVSIYVLSFREKFMTFKNYFKLAITSIILIILITFFALFAWRASVNLPDHVKAYKDSSFSRYFYVQWCRENNYAGYTYPSEEERIHVCKNAMMMDVNLNDAARFISLFICFGLGIIISIYLYFYIKWVRKKWKDT